MSDFANWLERWQTALRQQHRALFDYQEKSLKPEFAEWANCPVCESAESAFLFEKDWFRHVQCPQCGMVYMNPRMNEAATHAFYNSDVNEIYNETKFDRVSASTEMDDHINYDNLALIDGFRNGRKGVLLEIGSAKGHFLTKAREKGYSIYGLELNQKNYNYSRANLGDTILDVDLSEAHFDDDSFDIVYMRDVIEHIPAPKSFLREVSRVTKPGGIVFIDTHNIDGWIYKITRGRHVVIFGFEHPVHWSPRTLGRILAQNGIVVRKVKQASLDFTMQDILSYLINPSFTTIYPPEVSRIMRIVAKFLLIPFRFKPVRWLDRTILPRLANLFGRGSVMKVIAEKVA